jgi:2-amino-4-hydroxy-6-hydroxymethyldihydropteridine diphosphokinase
MGPQDQHHYLNAVVQLDTELSPLDLLDQLQQFEKDAGRIRLRHWGERTLDLDLLIYGQEQIHNERLTVPHVGVLERDFVVIPLLDLDDHLQINGHSLRDLELLQQANLTVIADQSWANA